MPHRTNGRLPWESGKKMRAAAYYRDLDASRFLPYEELAGNMRLCAKVGLLAALLSGNLAAVGH